MKTCLITGASSGIGEKLLNQLVLKGYRVIAIARNQDKLDMLSDHYQDNVLTFSCDVANKQQVFDICRDLEQKNIKPDEFFLNAGIAPEEALAAVDTSLHESIFATNYYGVLYWIEYWLPKLIKEKQKAKFIATSSFSAINAFPCFSGYSASKAAINQCFEILQLQHRRQGIEFLYVLSGPVETPLLEGAQIKGMILPKVAATKIIQASEKGLQAAKFPGYWKCFSFIYTKLPQRLKEKLIYG